MVGFNFALSFRRRFSPLSRSSATIRVSDVRLLHSLVLLGATSESCAGLDLLVRLIVFLRIVRGIFSAD